MIRRVRVLSQFVGNNQFAMCAIKIGVVLLPSLILALVTVYVGNTPRDPLFVARSLTCFIGFVVLTRYVLHRLPSPEPEDSRRT